MIKIGITGTPSSGKTTIANYIKQVVGNEGVLVPEVARDYIQQFGGIKNDGDQWSVALLQMAEENILAKSNPKYLICESPVWVSEVYMQHYFLKDDRSIERLIKLRRLFSDYKYDIILHCGNTGNYVKDGVRYQDVGELPALEKTIKEVMGKYHSGKCVMLPKELDNRKLYINKLIGELNGN